jgi:hypothetical protein
VSRLENIIATAIVLLSPAGLVYAWYFYVVRMLKEPAGWRSRVTLVVLVLVSSAVVMWPIARITAPHVNWKNWDGAGAYMDWMDAWERAALRIILAALVLSFTARPRLILPVALGCVGTGLFWLFSNIP